MKKINIKKLKELWKIPKYKAAMKLALYVLMMLIICIFLSVGSRLGNNDIQNKVENNNIKSFSSLKNDLLVGTYQYKYEVSNNDNKIIYEGSCYQNTCLGYKETSYETIKYYLEGSNVYKLVLGEKIEYNELYINLNANFLNLNYVFNSISDIDSIKETKDGVNSSSYILENSTINIYYTDKYLTKIEITTENNNYSMEFSNIGNITIDKVKI